MADIKQPCCHKLKDGHFPPSLHYLRASPSLAEKRAPRRGGAGRL